MLPRQITSTSCVPFERQVAITSLLGATRCSEQWLRVYRLVLVEIFVSATGFCRRKLSQFKFERVNCVTCGGDRILSRRQGFDCTKIT